MLPTSNKKGLYVISGYGIFKVTFNAASFTFKKTTANPMAFTGRHYWPVAMYVGEEYANCL